MRGKAAALRNRYEAPRLVAQQQQRVNMKVYGFHFIFSAYGFWLPNDPRGSWSDVVRQFALRRFGAATKVDTTRSVAHHKHDRQLRLAAKKALRYPPVEFTGVQAVEIAQGFATAFSEHDYAVHALAILPDHVHLVMAWHPRHMDEIAAHLKAKATASLSQQGLHPLARFAGKNGRIPSPWARNYWCPFITDERHMRVAIRYVEANPVKAGFKPQRWSLVTPYTA
jgi:REP element-mobilizing transposase RayT